jgi:lantibiotic biosynthesis protein
MPTLREEVTNAPILSSLRMDTPPTTESQVRWTPLFEGAEATTFKSALASISTALAQTAIVERYGGSLSAGTAGVALYFAYLAEATGEERWRTVSRTYVAHAVSSRSPSLDPAGFYRGDAGVAAMAAHLTSRGVTSNPATCPAVDQWLMRHLEERPWKWDYDLIGGLVGYGTYALERIEFPEGRVLLERVVDRLLDTCVPTKEGVTWWTAPELLSDSRRASYPEGCFNLGLAHGLPGVIALLAQAVAFGVAAGKARRLLGHAVQWLLAQHNAEGTGCCFPAILPANQRHATSRRSRVSWCHGDLGVSAALYWAATTLNEPAWGGEALAIARHAATRPPHTSGVVDAGLCHGAAGNGHIFNRFYQSTGDPRFQHAARYWFTRTLDFYKPGNGLASFRMWRAETAENGRWEWVPGLLEGVTGVGLAVLAAVTPAIEPAWDRILLVSIPLPLHRELPADGQPLTHTKKRTARLRQSRPKRLGVASPR